MMMIGDRAAEEVRAAEHSSPSSAGPALGRRIIRTVRAVGTVRGQWGASWDSGYGRVAGKLLTIGHILPPSGGVEPRLRRARGKLQASVRRRGHRPEPALTRWPSTSRRRPHSASMTPTATRVTAGARRRPITIPPASSRCSNVSKAMAPFRGPSRQSSADHAASRV